MYKTLVDEGSVATSTSTTLADSKVIELGEHTNDVVVVAEGQADSNATSDVTIHIRNSYNGEDFDTVDADSFDVPTSESDSLVRKSYVTKNKLHFLKAIVENGDSTYTADDVKVIVDTK